MTRHWSAAGRSCQVGRNSVGGGPADRAIGRARDSPLTDSSPTPARFVCAEVRRNYLWWPWSIFRQRPRATVVMKN